MALYATKGPDCNRDAHARVAPFTGDFLIPFEMLAGAAFMSDVSSENA